MRVRLGLVSTVAVTVGLAVAATVAYVVTSRVLSEQIDDSLRGGPTAITRTDDGPVPSLRVLCENVRSSQAPAPSLFTIEILRSDGSTCSDPDDPHLVTEDADLEATRSSTVNRIRDGRFSNGDSARVAVISAADGSALLLGRNTQDVKNVLETLKLVLSGLTLLGGLLALVLSHWTSAAALVPITRFTREAEAIAKTGDLEQHVSSRPPLEVSGRRDELDRLADAFNTMTRVLADLQSRQRRLVADAGHELRTPLTSLRANIALLVRSRQQDRPLSRADEDRLLEDLTKQLHELTSLVEDVVQLASSDSDGPPLEPVRYDRCVERAVARSRSRAADVVFDVHVEAWTVAGDERSIERAVVNLLDNAIKFSPAGAQIEVRLAEGRLTIADRGPGVTAEEMRRGFERFWRSPRARALPGSGLGLSIVDDVARRHGGERSLQPRTGGGSVASLWLPGSAQ